MKTKILTPLFIFLPLIGSVNSDHLDRCGQTRIAVIDTGLNLNDPRFKGHLCEKGHKNFVDDESLDDVNNHGTHVAGLIEKYAGNANYCMLIYKYYEDSSPGYVNEKREVASLREAIKNGATIINYSGGGSVFSEDEALLIKNHPEVIFVVAAGNEGKSLDISGNEYYPASLFYKNIEVVENIDESGNRATSSNYGSKVKNKEIGTNVTSLIPDGRVGVMSGTSQATAVFSGKLVAKKSKACNYKE